MICIYGATEHLLIHICMHFFYICQDSFIFGQCDRSWFLLSSSDAEQITYAFIWFQKDNY